MATYASIAYDQVLSNANSLVLLSEQSASDGDANLTFTNIFDSTYKEYICKIIDAHPETDLAEFGFQVDVSGGSSYAQTITSTYLAAYIDEDDHSSAATTYGTANDQAQGTALQYICDQVGNGADESTSGYLHISNPSSTTFTKLFYSRMQTYNGDGVGYSTDVVASGYVNTATAITNIQFKFSSGDFDEGTIKIYGVK